MDAAFWVDVVWKAATALAVAFYVPVTRSLDRLGVRQDKSEKDLADISQRLTRAESELRALPTDTHISELHEKINEVRNLLGDELGKLSGKFTGFETTLNIIHRHIIESKK